LQIALTGGADEHPVQLLMRLESAPSMPVLLKDTPMYSEAPPEAPWHNAFDEALRLAARGQWRAAEARWKALIPQSSGSAGLWQNLAIVRGNLGDYAGCVEALHHVASLEVPAAVSLDDAVEAEALAQLLDQQKAEGTVDSVLVTFAVQDVDELERRLASDKQADATEIDTRVFAEAQQPPPRAAYWLLDRPLVTSGAELSREQIPQILGQLLLFGKQTDREARLELDIHRPYLDRGRTELTRIAGDAIRNQQSEEVTGSMSAVQLAMSWQWRLPSDMSDMHRRKLIADERRALVLDRWPSLPLPLLGGKAPAEAASDPANRVRLLGAILLLEQSEANPAMAPAYDELRRKLDLPTPEPIDPSGIDVMTLRLVCMPRLLVEKLSDEQLQQVFRRLAMVGYAPAMRRVAAELVGRASPALLEYKHAAYQYLVHGEEDTDKALEWIEAGRTTAEQLRRSTASWDLDELTVRVQRQDGQEAAKLIMHIRNEHGREPGVAEALFGILARLGMVGPDGTLMVPATAPGTTPPGIVVPGVAAEPGKLWTPESQAPAGKKSALWVPE
jgi:hypothetical protein